MSTLRIKFIYWILHCIVINNHIQKTKLKKTKANLNMQEGLLFRHDDFTQLQRSEGWALGF